MSRKKILVVCALCIVSFVIFSEHHEHNYRWKRVNENYQFCDATQDHGALFYYSCWCGEKGNVLFSFGEALPSEKMVVATTTNPAVEKTDAQTTIIIVNTPTSLNDDLWELLGDDSASQVNYYYYYYNNYYDSSATQQASSTTISTNSNVKKNTETKDKTEENKETSISYQNLSCDYENQLKEETLQQTEHYKIAITGYGQNVSITLDSLEGVTVKLFQDAEMKQELQQLADNEELLSDFYLNGTAYLQINTGDVPAVLSILFEE